MSQKSIIPAQGERALIVGQTGSGKTAFATYLVERIMIAPIVIMDAKFEPKFDKLGARGPDQETGKPRKPANVSVTTMQEAEEYLNNPEIDYIIVRPPDEIVGEPRLLDDYLWYHYLHFKNVPIFIDELYMFQVNGRAGRGLINLLQRGRSKGITLIGCTQRPVRVDRACFTEANKVYIFKIVDKQDRKRIDDIIPNFSEYPQPQKHGFYFFDTGEDDDRPQLMAPIKLGAGYDTGYVDSAQASHDEKGEANEQDLKPTSRHQWF